MSDMKIWLLCFLLTLSVGCTHPPPTLSPQARTAFQNTRVIKGLDLLRDTAIDANAQVPPQLSEVTTRKVVTYHRSALLIIHASGSGWQSAVQTGLDELLRDLPPVDQTLLTPYVTLLKVILSEVTR